MASIPGLLRTLQNPNFIAAMLNVVVLSVTTLHAQDMLGSSQIYSETCEKRPL